MQSALHIHGICIHNLTNWKSKNVQERKDAESYEKQNLNLLWAGSYLHSIYIVLGIVSHLEMI